MYPGWMQKTEKSSVPGSNSAESTAIRSLPQIDLFYRFPVCPIVYSIEHRADVDVRRIGRDMPGTSVLKSETANALKGRSLDDQLHEKDHTH